MRVLVCGSRDWDDANVIAWVLDGISTGWDIEVITGMASGADSIATNWAEVHHRPHRDFPADWERHGRGAGPLRNQAMLIEGKPDLVVAFTDDLSKSRGTADMVARAKAAGVAVYVVGRG